MPEYEIGPWHTVPGFDVKGNFLPKFTEVEPMSDFKVGDVVRYKIDHQRAYRHGQESGRVVADTSNWNGMAVLWSDGTRTMMFDDAMEVSRPSEAKPSAPALKVGDRVRVKGTQHVGDVVRHTTTGWWGVVFNGANGDTWVIGYEADRLELLLPEPAKPPMRADEFHRLRQPEPRNLKPMTATEASIKDRQRAGYQHLNEELKSYALKPLWTVHPSVLKALELESIKPGAVIPYNEDPPNNGWMPAGTYMPLGRAAVEPTIKMIKVPLPYQKERRATLGCSDGGGSTLAAKDIGMVRRGRYWRNQTLSWSNAGDDYELLEDAE